MNQAHCIYTDEKHIAGRVCVFVIKNLRNINEEKVQLFKMGLCKRWALTNREKSDVCDNIGELIFTMVNLYTVITPL